MKANRSRGVLGIFVGLAVVLSGCAVGIEETSDVDSGSTPTMGTWAVSDTLSIARDESGTTGDVRSNDMPPNTSDATRIGAWTDGSKGSVQYNGDGTFTYTPDPNIDSGTDSFTYTAIDASGNYSTGTVDVTIAAGWGRVVTASTHYGSYQRQTDDNDNTTLVWQEYDGTRYNLWAKRFTAATKTWSAAQKIDSSDADQGQGISFSSLVDDTGNVTVVWRQSFDTTGSRYDLWANRFSISTGTWGTAALIESDDSGSPSGQSLVTDSSGNVTVVWYTYDGAFYNIWGNRYASGAWGAATKLDSEDLGNAFPISGPSYVDGSGNVTVIWYQSDGVRNNLWANRYTGGAWQTATKIETEDLGSISSDVRVVIDSLGTLTAVWYQSDGTRNNLWANRLTTSTTLNGTAIAATKIETEDLGSATGQQLVLDPTSRNVTVVWYQSDGTRNNMWANRFRANVSSWGTATKIETEDLGNVSTPNVTIDASANVTVLWTQTDGTRYNLWANRLGSGQNFNGTPIAATLVETENFGDVINIQSVLAESSGNITAIWRQYDGTRYNLWSNRYSTTTSTWGTAAKIETDDASSANTPSIVIDDAGNVTAAWSQSDGVRNNIWANHMSAAGVWGTAAKVDTEDLGSAGGQRLVVNSSGVVDLVWYQGSVESYDIWTSRFSGGAWSTADRLNTGLTGLVSFPLEFFNTSADVATLVGYSTNDYFSTLWMTDLR